MENNGINIQDLPEDLIQFFVPSNDPGFELISGGNEFIQEGELFRFGNQPSGDYSSMAGEMGDPPSYYDSTNCTPQEGFSTPFEDFFKAMFELGEMPFENDKNKTLHAPDCLASLYMSEDNVESESNNSVLTDISNQNFEIIKQELPEKECNKNNSVLTDISNQNFEILKQEFYKNDVQENSVQSDVKENSVEIEVQQNSLENNDFNPFYINLNINDGSLADTIQVPINWSNENSNILYCSDVKPENVEAMQVPENEIAYSNVELSSPDQINIIDSSNSTILQYDQNNEISHLVILNANDQNNSQAAKNTLVICRQPFRTRSMMAKLPEDTVSDPNNLSDIQTVDALDCINVGIPVLSKNANTVKKPRKEKLKLRYSKISTIIKDAVCEKWPAHKKGEELDKTSAKADEYADEKTNLLAKMMLRPCNSKICSENTGVRDTNNYPGISRKGSISSIESDLSTTPIVSRPLRCLKCSKLYKSSRALKMHERHCKVGVGMNSTMSNMDQNDGNKNPKQSKLSDTKMTEAKRDIHEDVGEHSEESSFFRRSTRSQTRATRSSNANNGRLLRKQNKK